MSVLKSIKLRYLVSIFTKTVFSKLSGSIITSRYSMKLLILLEKLTVKSLERLESLYSLLLMEMNFGLLLLKKLTLKLMEGMLLSQEEVVDQHLEIYVELQLTLTHLKLVKRFQASGRRS